MHTKYEQRTPTQRPTVSRRLALKALGVGITAAALTSRGAGATSEDCSAPSYFGPLASDDPATLIDAYIGAVNNRNLEAILDLYVDDAIHIFLPTPDGSAGICIGKDEFRMWYEQSLANDDRVELGDGTLVVDGNQAVYVVRISSDPWTKLGLDALEAHSEMVLTDSRIMTHVVMLTPESVRRLQVAQGSSGDARGAPPFQSRPGQPY